jgi:transposase
LITKRLEKGTFKTPWRAEQRHVVIEGAELLLVLEGIELRGSVRRPRWQPGTRPD